MFSINQLGKWFLEKENNISAKKLQKLCWFAYAWYIALEYNPEDSGSISKLVKDDIPQAWVHGPVFPKLYREYKTNGKINISQEENIENAEILEFLNKIFEVYGHYTGNELESISHQELPWLSARGNCGQYDVCTKEIKDKDILTEYLPRLN